ncbi:MAG: putative porin [Candidatus Omnitrophica bacterium]|nr:putative porin [Candidatus Omnitrophota bacterium]
MKKWICIVVGVVLMSLSGLAYAATTQVDALIEKLIEKNILTKQEARDIKQEIVADQKVIHEEAMKSSLPEWIQKTKLKGDARVRYQYERKKDDTEARSRGRVRFRLGLENQVNDQWKMGAGLATSETGSTADDARSTNMTFTDGFRRGDIRLDYAFAEYQPAPWGKVIAGKFVRTDYLWTPTDLLWDSDINPAGGSLHVEHKFSENINAYLNNGVWVIDENGKTDRVDPFLVYSQAGIKSQMGPVDLHAAGTYYGFNGVKGTTVDGTSSTNTLTGGVLRYDYDSLGASAEIGLKKPMGLKCIERLAFFGDYIQNLDPDDNETGWAAGLKFGDSKVVGRNQWQVKYQYSSLGKDAFLDAFPDSDRLGGVTDTKGHEWTLEYGLAKNVVVGLDYYLDDRILGTHNRQTLIQADLNLKF